MTTYGKTDTTTRITRKLRTRLLGMSSKKVKFPFIGSLTDKNKENENVENLFWPKIGDKWRKEVGLTCTRACRECSLICVFGG